MNVGDKVQFTGVQRFRGGGSFVLHAWEGTITQIDGETVTIKRRGKLYDRHISRVRAIGERNELTEMVMGKK